MSAATHDDVFDAWAARREGWNPRFCAPILRLGLRHLEGHTREHGVVLDLGCGDGQVAGALAACGFRAVGVDIDLPAIEASRRRHPSSHLVNASMTDLPFADAGSDALFAFSSFQYSDRVAIVSECARVLRPGGVFVVVENLFGNPVAVLHRWRTRGHDRQVVHERRRKVHLRKKQIRQFERVIGPTSCEYFHLTTPILLVFSAAFDETRPRTFFTRLVLLAYALLLKIDRILLTHLHVLEPFAWQVLITGRRQP